MLQIALFSNPCFTQEIKFSEDEYNKSLQEYSPSISKKYYRGKNLIYDCKDQHFACVSLLNYENCQQQRKQEINNQEVLLSCAPLKNCKDQIECFTLQYSLIHAQTNKAFCINQLDYE